MFVSERVGDLLVHCLGLPYEVRAARGLSRKRGLLTKVFAGLIFLVAAYVLARSLGPMG